MLKSIVLTIFSFMSLVQAHAEPPDVSHLSTRDRDLVLTCERVNGFIERELKAKGASPSLTLEGMCMFGQLQPIRWYVCMERNFKQGLTQKQAATGCGLVRKNTQAP